MRLEKAINKTWQTGKILDAIYPELTNGVKNKHTWKMINDRTSQEMEQEMKQTDQCELSLFYQR